MELQENCSLLKKPLKLFVHGLAQAVLKFLVFGFGGVFWGGDFFFSFLVVCSGSRGHEGWVTAPAPGSGAHPTDFGSGLQRWPWGCSVGWVPAGFAKGLFGVFLGGACWVCHGFARLFGCLLGLPSHTATTPLPHPPGSGSRGAQIPRWGHRNKFWVVAALPIRCWSAESPFPVQNPS